MKVIYYAAVSLDGFIADANHGVEWLDQIDIKQSSVEYEKFFDQVDGLLMGRKSFDFVYNYGQWPYESRPTWVCSNRKVPTMKGCNLQNEHTPGAALQAAERRGVSTLWFVGGGQLASTLIKTGQLTHLSVSVMPILLGDGIPLVQNLPRHLHLRQVEARQMQGFTQIDYRLDTLQNEEPESN